MRSLSTPGSSLASFLDDADAGHAQDPTSTVAALLARVPVLPADGDGARALRLLEHVALAHLADTSGLVAALACLPAELAMRPATAGMVQRLHWARAMVDGLPPPSPGPADIQRWRALQNVVLALAARGRCAEAAALLAADEATASQHGRDEAGQAYAATANNVAMELQTSSTRDAGRDGLMLQAAQIARRAWGHAGDWRHAERAEYRLALCHAVAGQGAAAVQHAQRCLAGCQAAGDAADAVEHFFAHEALARAQQVAGDAAAAAAAKRQMARLLPQIDAADGLRDWCAQALAALPA